ncbi:MAG: flagellar biosynthesis protein FlhB [Planctomycetota bacterium]
MSDDMGEKSEQPTGKKLADVRKRGTVPKSQDFTAAVGLAGATIAVWVFGPAALDRLAGLTRGMLSAHAAPGWSFQEDGATVDFAIAMETAGLAAVPFVAAAFLVALAVNFLQVGPLLTFEPLKPKVNKFDPVKGVSRLFNKKAQVKNVLSLLKVSVVIGVVYLVLATRFDDLALLPALAVHQAASVIAEIALHLALVLTIIMILLGVADLMFQRWQHKQDNKMTKNEVKNERQSMEGDPQVKGKRRQMHRDILLNQIKGETPNADVIVTNPTHFSVALKYDGETMRAPTVVAKGADLLAFQMRQIGGAAGVPIIERPPLARALYWGVPVGSEVSPEHYDAVAEVLAYVYRIEGEARDRAPINSRDDAA